MAEADQTAWAFPSEAEYDRVVEGSRTAERIAREIGGQDAALPQRPAVVFVRVTSDIAETGGFYPCVQVLEEADGTLVDGDEMWAKVANAGEDLKTPNVYDGYVVGVREAAGVTKALVKVVGASAVTETFPIEFQINADCTISVKTYRQNVLRGRFLRVASTTTIPGP